LGEGGEEDDIRGGGIRRERIHKGSQTDEGRQMIT